MTPKITSDSSDLTPPSAHTPKRQLDTDSSGLPGWMTPVFILAPPRSFSTVVCAMLGQHPDLYGLPETHLFCADTIVEWFRICAEETFPMADGLLRAISELWFGSQTEDNVARARAWLERRRHLTTGFLLELLGKRVQPSILVDKSPSFSYQIAFMQRAYRMFPDARFVHLLRHPRGHCLSVLKYLERRTTEGPLAPNHWLLTLASYGQGRGSEELRLGEVLDPQQGWYTLNRNICQFLATIPEERWLRIRGEDLLSAPERVLPRITSWLGLETDLEAIEEMLHPESSPYAHYGPPGARFGQDTFFLDNPTLRPERGQSHNLEGPLTWRKDNSGFSREVVALARDFGYT
jgi:Sulfotransferase family